MQALSINADLERRAVVDGSAVPWQDSPMPGVQRRMLERDGGEQARATSIVRYAPGSRFSPHVHDGGEELFVLDGVFEDELGSYGPGTYIKNPPGSAHAPASAQGCVLWVKLRHLAQDDRERLVVDTQATAWRPGLVPGLSVLSLSSYGTEHTALVRWAPGTYFQKHRHVGGEEIYVLSGVFEDEHGRYPAGHWLRSPHMSQHTPFSLEGCTILVKTGHLT
ncbi:MAG: cupin domain-containing protein [Myxococcales bacterium]|nr:cupin domain-containing protein [Myxococcales bacterium]